MEVKVKEDIKLTELSELREIKALQVSDNADKKKARTDLLLSKLKTSDAQYQKLLSKFSPEKLERISNKVESYKYGIHAIAPIMCFGAEKCPFFYACPLGNGVVINKEGKKVPQYDSVDDFPVGDQCILERTFIEQKLIDYVQEFEIDPNKASEVSLINDLALIDLQKQRAVLFLAGGDKNNEGLDFMKVDESFDKDGITGLAYKEHPLFGIIDRLEKRRLKILEELIGTRRGKAHAAAKFTEVVGQSHMLKELEMIREAIAQNNTPIKIKDKLDDVWELE